jgi:hypothetical protein
MEKQVWLHTWLKDWDLPSLAPECIEAQALFLLCGVSFHQIPSHNPLMSYKARLPFALVGAELDSDDNIVLSDIEEIRSYLKTEVHDLDATLDAQEMILSRSVSAYVREKMEPAEQYMLWLDEANKSEVMRAYQQRNPLKIKFIWNSERNKALALNLHDHDVLIRNFDEVCETLSTLLAEKQTFFSR